MAQSRKMQEELDECYVRTAGLIIEYFDEAEKVQALQKLRNTFKENCREAAKLQHAHDVVKEMAWKYESFTAEQTGGLEEVIAEYKHGVTKKFRFHEMSDGRLAHYDCYVENMYRANKQREAANTQKENTNDEELQMTDSQINVIDPISKIRIVDPVRNTVCGHVYDKQSVTALLEKNKKTRCPVIGCNSKDYINLNLCRTDIPTKMYLEKNPA